MKSRVSLVRRDLGESERAPLPDPKLVAYDELSKWEHILWEQYAKIIARQQTIFLDFGALYTTITRCHYNGFKQERHKRDRASFLALLTVWSKRSVYPLTLLPRDVIHYLIKSGKK